MIPGQIFTKNKQIILNTGREIKQISVSNQGDRPVQVGSHFHFFETNKLLTFDRQEAYGMRLDIPSGTSVRFEPGEVKTVQLVTIGGAKKVFGFNNLSNGEISGNALQASLKRAGNKGFISTGEEEE